MGKGKPIVENSGVPGRVGYETAGQWDFIYRASTVKDAKYDLGDRTVLPDGRVFRYASANGTLKTQWGAKCWDEETIKWASVAANRDAGDNYITVTVDADDGVTSDGTDAAGVIAKDELRGGYVVVYQTGSDLVRQHYGIIGNTATTGAGTITIYLDASLAVAVTTSSYVEVMGNIYGNVKTTNNGYTSVVGVAMVAATDGQYCWLQTWGPICISPGATGQSGNGVGSTGEERCLVFGGNGCIYERNVGDSADQRQIAGFILNKSTASAGGPPFIMLQISP